MKIKGYILPCFITEWVACYEKDSGVLETTINMDNFDPSWDVTPDAVVEVRVFSWLGFGWFGNATENILSYEEWKEIK